MAGFRKRVFARAFGATGRSRTSKRKRFTRRRRTGGGRSSTLTTQSGVGKSFGFKSRKVSRRRWNNLLWNNTLQQSHYRTSFAIGSNHVTQASSTVGTVVYLGADDNGTAPFWQTLGGALIEDVGSTIPTFVGDVTLRGATMGIIIGNTNDAVDFDNLRVQVFLIKTGDRYDGSAVPATATVGFDPTLIPDFKIRLGRIVMQKEFLLDNNQTAEFKFRHPIQKYDQGEYTNGSHRYNWFIIIANTTQVLTTTACRITTYMNGSFSADAT